MKTSKQDRKFTFHLPLTFAADSFLYRRLMLNYIYQMINNEDIFGTFRPLTPAQIKGNAKFVALWSAPALIVIAGVVAAVKTGIIWIAAASALIWLITFMLVVRKCTIRYEPRFGIKFNMLRFIPCGAIVYGGIGWRGLLSIYHRYIMDHWDLSLESYGNMLIALTLSVTLIVNLHLYQHKNRHTADAIGMIETAALALFLSSLMFRLLYT